MTDRSIRVDRIVDIAEYIEEYLAVLSSKQAVDFDAYVADRELRDVVERRFETMTQACLDIARILLVDLEYSVPESERRNRLRGAARPFALP
ncbi:HepT-like ribonuclease domain-containing protein [Halopiger goleimassiliensis]|uniref:HepT-like ribonuclease domain-containing protein n=1 Tax=Halopiger goleimassiliensis TaxID=1293048 RepID=UPI0006781507|nr:HepT-like ribonuclease domain-containing protein [Halopiger goleimassiliensis]